MTGMTAGVDDDDDFWAQQGDIIDQMVQQHSLERKLRGATQGTQPLTGEDDPAMVPFLSTQNQATQGQEHASALLAEKEGMLSILREKLGKAEVELVHLRRRLQELTNQPARSIVEKSAAIHLEQQVQQLKQQLAFKEEEIVESRRLRLQREEKLHQSEQAAAKLAANLKRLEATHATAEAENILRRQGTKAEAPSTAVEHSNLAHKPRNMRSRNALASSGSPVPATWSPQSSSYYNADADRSTRSKSQPKPSPARSQRFSRLHIGLGDRGTDNVLEGHINSAHQNVLQSCSQLFAYLTGYSGPGALESEVARDVRGALVSSGSLSSLVLVLLQYLLRKQQSRVPGQEASSQRSVDKSLFRTDFVRAVVELMFNILSADYCSRVFLASCLVQGDGSQGDDRAEEIGGLFRPFLELLEVYSPTSVSGGGDATTTTYLLDILSMTITCFGCSSREPFLCVVNFVLTGLGLNEMLSAQSSSGDPKVRWRSEENSDVLSIVSLVSSSLSFLYYALQCPNIVACIIDSESLQVALFCLIDGAISHHRDYCEQDSKRGVRHGSNRGFALNREAFSVSALVFRQLLGRFEVSKSQIPMRVGKSLIAVIHFIHFVLKRLEEGKQSRWNIRHRKNDDDVVPCVDVEEALVAVLDGLCLIQIMLSAHDSEDDHDGDVLVDLILKPMLRVPSLVRQLHTTIDMLVKGQLQMVSWPDHRIPNYTPIPIPELWQPPDCTSCGDQVVTPVDLATSMAKWVYQHISQHQLTK